ncbi:MAG: hypothetical protein ACJ8R9_30825 [Steroidobacteraceae bacterium]
MISADEAGSTVGGSCQCITARNAELCPRDAADALIHHAFMEEDAEALDQLRDLMMASYPLGRQRDWWLEWVPRIALETRCPQWPHWCCTYH